ncbi:MAG: MFS transporter [Candidatus Omnitrophota bacterium]
MRNKNLFWIFALSGSVYFTQGIEGLPSQGLFYYFKETLNFSPQKIMVLSSIIIFAWIVKPLIGYVIDHFFNKRIWIFIALTLDIILVLLVGLLQLPIFLLIAILMLNSANAAFRDVAVDGIMCVEGKKYKATGKIQSIQWASVSAAGLITGIGGGFVAEKWGYQAGYLLLVPFYLLVSLPAYFYKEDDYMPVEKAASSLAIDLKKLFTNKNLLIVALFIFLYRYSPSFGTPLMFIQRDSFLWTKTWIGILGTIATVFGIIGALLYYKFSQGINIKKWLFWSVFVGAILTLSYLYYTPVTAVVYDMFYSFLGMFIMVMSMDFMARNSIPGLEATSFALLCSVSNLAIIAGNLSGAYLLPLVGLKWLIVLSAITSFLCLPLIKRIK